MVACAETWIAPLPGTTKLHRLEENIGAVAVELTPEDLRLLETAASKITLQGARYPEELQKLVGAERQQIANEAKGIGK